MTKALMVTSLAFATLLVSAPADAQRRAAGRVPALRSGAEGGLLGVKLFDSGVRVVGLYGNPDQIVSISGGGTAAGGGGGGQGGGRGGFGGPGGGAGGGRGGGGAGGVPPTTPGLDSTGPDMGPAGVFQGRPAGGDAPGGSGRGPAGPGGPPPPGGGGAPGGGGGTATSGDFTRWIYTKSGSKFGFVLDKFNRVVQIEAIGLQNQRVRTRRGIGFGATFSQVMKAYGTSSAPDGYETAGDQVTVKWLTRQRVAFRLTKLGAKQAHVVTGIVVAAGKG